ncbi:MULTISPECIES: hypothetical protein [unclassified Corynebacterium]|uniref:hypothetical protein n=1 Tax=unclassified Corynebacterium TaxID=2624378 RepID=UPI0029CA2DD9|nr:MULTISPECIES: hypothetical protein [unclassified Corynebacterium]WPF66472.1 hypothetical protein OLX12_01730 [Corynebacterium sp. 22KM0430]WPF68962.1 hypothetical protein OLW90_01730 [Corynebacterium sp. 21KM1197]
MPVSDPLSYEDAEQLVQTVRAITGVADIHAGTFGEASLLYPGQRVRGLRLREDSRLEVHIVADLDAASDLHGLAENVRRTVHAATGFTVDVFIADAVTTVTTMATVTTATN